MADLKAPWPADSKSLRARSEEAEVQTEGDGLEVEDDEPADPEKVRWAAGALDALMGGAPSEAKQITGRSLVASLGKLTRHPSDAALAHFYHSAAKTEVIDIVDPFLELLRHGNLNRERTADVARRIASEAPDLAAVKLIIAMLGEVGEVADAELISALGVFEELTLYSAVAIRRILEDPEPAIWGIAKRTRGWGRIQALRRLQSPRSAELRNWMLTEGHRNAVMTEEIAYFCATEGGLLQALQQVDPSEDLLDGAGDLLSALVNGGPAEDMDDYADGGEASRLFIEHLLRRPSTNLERFLVQSLQSFEGDAGGDWSSRAQLGWTTANRWAVRTGAASYLGRPEWREIAEAGLLEDDWGCFWSAAAVGKALGLDTWPHYFRRQASRQSEEWYFLMQTRDVDRVHQVIALAMAQLDLVKVGSGPTRSLGLGPEYRDDSAMDFILQDLKRFPGVGWPLIEVGLRARTTRARNMAHKALKAWGRNSWPEEALPALQAALAREPDEDVALRIRALIDGRSLDD